MASNRKRALGRQLLGIPTTDKAGVDFDANDATTWLKSGAPCAVGQRPGVLLVDQDATQAVVVDHDGVYSLSVTSIDAQIDPGAILYILETGVITDDVDGTGAVRFGYALEEVANGATTVIDVKIGY